MIFPPDVNSKEFREIFHGTQKIENITDDEKKQLNIILAALDLYKALKILVENHDSTCRPESLGIERARRAIAKAEGR